MVDFKSIKEDIKHRMDGAFDVLKREFSGLRTGRAATSLLEPVSVDAYGSEMPLNQVGTIGAPEPRLLTVQVWDKGLIKSVEKAIMESGLGLNPSSDGNLVRIPIPQLTEERRTEIGKIANRYAEDARIAVRNVRRHAMDEVKALEKDSNISEDQHHDYAQEIQKITDETVKRIDGALDTKEQEIMQV